MMMVMKNRESKIDRMGPVMQKILLVLLAGTALTLSRRPFQSFKMISEVTKEWNRINKRALRKAIRALYQSKLIDAKDNKDGTTSMSLNSKGKQRALTYQIDTIHIPKMQKCIDYENHRQLSTYSTKYYQAC